MSVIFEDGIYKGLSTEEKPIGDRFRKATFRETDTGDYYYNLTGYQWELQIGPTDLENEVAVQKADYAKSEINVDMFPVPPNAVPGTGADDTDSFKAAVAYMKDNGTRKLICTRGKTYRLTDIINIDFDDIEINGNGAKIVWDKLTLYATTISGNGWFLNTADVGGANDYTYRGIFQLHGAKTNVSTAITSVYSYGKQSARYTTASNAEAAKFAKGDYVVLKVQTATNWADYDANVLQPKTTIIAKVTAVSAANVYLDYMPNWTYADGTYTASITKITPIKNAYIHDIVFDDNSPFTFMNPAQINADRMYQVSFIGGMYTSNLKIDNVIATGIKNPLIMDVFGYNTKVRNIELRDADCVGGGQGYLYQGIGCYLVTINNTVSSGERHNVDFAYSANCLVTMGVSMSCYHVGFSCHGSFDHDIKFVKCQGVFAFGQAGEAFGNANKNIILEDCFGVLSAKHVQGLEIIRGDITLSDAPYQLKADKAKITFNIKDMTTLKRGLTNAKFTLEKCELAYITAAESQLLFNNYEYVTIDSCEWNLASAISVFVTGAKKFVYKNTETPKLLIRVLGATENVEVTNSKFHCPGAGNFALSMRGITTNCNYKVDNCEFDNPETLANAGGVQLPNDWDMTAGKIINTWITNCIFYANTINTVKQFVGSKVHWINNHSSTSATNTVPTHADVINTGSLTF